MKVGSITVIVRTEDCLWNTAIKLPAPKEIKTQAYAGKVKFTVFWNSEGIVLTDLLEKTVRVN